MARPGKMILRIKKSKSNISGVAEFAIDAFAMSRNDALPPADLPGVNHRPKRVPDRDGHIDLLTPLVADGKKCRARVDLVVCVCVAIRIRPGEHQEREEPEAVSEQFVQISSAARTAYRLLWRTIDFTTHLRETNTGHISFVAVAPRQTTKIVGSGSTLRLFFAHYCPDAKSKSRCDALIRQVPSGFSTASCIRGPSSSGR